MKRKNPFILFLTSDTQNGGGMSENTEVSADEKKATSGQDGEATENSGSEWDQARAMEKIRKTNAENKNLRERAKAAEEKVSETVDYEERASKAEKTAMKLKEAYKLGLPIELAERLQGDTPEEIALDAENLMALFIGDDKPALPERPKPMFKGGVRPDNKPEMDADAIVAKALGR